MKTNLKTTTVKDISYLISNEGLRATSKSTLEKLAKLLDHSGQNKVYLEDENSKLCGVVHARLIACKILELSRKEDEQEEMLPAITYVLNSLRGSDIAERAMSVGLSDKLQHVLQLLERNSIREIAVVDANGCLLGTLDGRSILSHYLQMRAEVSLVAGGAE